MRRERATVSLIVGALLMRAAVIGVTRNDPVFRVPYLDSAFYHIWARSLAEGHGDFQGPYFLAPLYPHVLSWLYAIGASLWTMRVLQTLLGLVDFVLVVALGRRLFGRRAGLFGGVLFACHGTLVFYEGLLVLEPLLLALTLGGTATLLLARPVGARHALVSGVLFGLATLARGTALLAAPIALWTLARVSVRLALLLAVAWVAVLVPVLVRNAAQGGGLVLTTNAGVNFYAGNAPEANGRFRQPPGVQFFSAPLVHAQLREQLPPAVAERALTVEAVAGSPQAARSFEWLARSWEWIGAEPVAFAMLLLRKIGLVLQGREIGQIESLDFHRQRLPAWRVFVVSWTWILPLAALGIWCTRRKRSRQQRSLLGMAVVTLLPCVLFFVTARYRLVALPFLAPFAGAGAAWLLESARSRSWPRLLVAVLLCLVAGALTRVGGRPPLSAPGWSNAQMAERLYALGDLEGAIRFQEEATRWLPDRTEVLLNLALYWSERNTPTDLERAEQLLRAVVQKNPQQPIVLFNLGVILEQRGRPDEARDAWERALRVDPNFEPARARLQSHSP